MAKEKLFNVGVKALIENDIGRILLLRAGSRKGYTNQNYWDIPGGRIQEGETATDVLTREVEEETGIKELTDVKFFTGVISKHEYEQDGLHLGLVLMIYRVEVPRDSKITLSDEHTEFEWTDKKEAAERLSNKYPPELTDKL